MKKNKLVCFLSLAILSISTAGCEMLGLGGEKNDVNLYHLTLSYSSNVQGNQDDLVATYSYGERHDIHQRTQDEIDAYLQDGASQADIDKSTVRQADGSYYFFSGDPMVISAPDIEGYVFIGFYDKKTNDLYRPMLSPHSMDDGSTEMLMTRWNMPDRDTELEARYQVLEYSVSYCYGFTTSYGPDGTALPSGEIPQGEHSNPTRYNYETNGDVTLTAPTAQFNGYEFKYWFYYEQGTGNEIIVESLPKLYVDEVLHGSWSPSGVSNCSLVLFANYDILTYDVAFQIDEGVFVEINVMSPEGIERITNTDEPTSLEAGTTLEIIVDDSEIEIIRPGYHFDGIYVNDVRVPDIDLGGGLTRPDTRPYIDIEEDSLIEIRVAENLPE